VVPVTQAHPPGVDVAARPTNGRTECPCLTWHRPPPPEDVGHHPVPTGAPFHGDPKQPLLWICPTTHSGINACIRVHLRARKLHRQPTKLELAPFTKFMKRLALVAMAALDPQADVPLDP
jgi:hypothetical protein